MKKRVFMIVLDSFGIGELPDAAAYGDTGSNTLGTLLGSDRLSVPNLTAMGLFNIAGTDRSRAVASPTAAYARLAERSAGKDTTTGHWELAGVVSGEPMPLFPQGFPQEFLETVEKETGRACICNLPYSGTEVIHDYGLEHQRTGRIIVYTSADSVYQAAAHMGVISLEELYAYCRTVRRLCTGKYAVGRVIARPFEGEYPNYHRTSDRHDFSLEPPAPTLNDRLSKRGFDVISVGKINDVFAGRGITESHPTVSNEDGMHRLDEISERDFEGLCFANLVEFDMLYGHRNDTDGYAGALTDFDRWLGGFTARLREDDLLIITADHGCDPGTRSTDHSREYIPFLMYGASVSPGDLGTVKGFNYAGDTVFRYLTGECCE